MRVGDSFAVAIAGVGDLTHLRPSLRCAFQLVARPGGFPKLITEIQDGSLTAACDVLRAADADQPFLESKVMETGIHRLISPLTLFILACAGLDNNNHQDDRPKGKPISFSDHLSALYRYGTGWLGWPPEVTLDATPAQITEAMKGRTEMLQMIFGGNDDQDPLPAPDLGERFKSVFGGMGTTIIKRKPDA